MAARKQVRNGTKRQVEARRGTRPDPITTMVNQFNWGQISGNVDRERFDYQFWPPHMLGHAEMYGYRPVMAEAPGSAGAIKVAGGQTCKPGEPLRGMRDQVLCIREKSYGDQFRDYRRAYVSAMDERLGHDPVKAREGHAALVGRDAPEDEHIDVGVTSHQKLHLGEDPYPAYQE